MRLDGLLPPAARRKRSAYSRFSWAKIMPARIVDDGAEPVRESKAGRHVRRSASLAAVPGTKNQVWGISARNSASCSGYVAPTTAPMLP